MKTILTQAQDLLLAPADLDASKVQRLIQTMMGQHIDAADLYFQSCHSEGWYLEDSVVKSGAYAIDKGVGIRAVSGEKTGYAYCDDILLPAIERAATAARSIAYQHETVAPQRIVTSTPCQRYTDFDPLTGMTAAEKIKLLEQVDREARGLDARVIQVNASLSGSYEVVMIVDLAGRLSADIRPQVSLHVSVVVEENGRREAGRCGGGGRQAYTYFLEEERALSYAREAVREALLNLKAEAAPAGTMPVVLGPGWTGVLLHEAVGHGLEGDFNRKGLSAFSGRMGEQVAAPSITVVDDGTLAGRRGSLTIDDEGTATQCTTLIENGKLVNYMQDNLNARLMNMQPTGNCRRESYAHLPMPRMTNTYLLAGTYAPEEIIRSVDRGIYAVNLGGGQVDITSGQFVFSVSEGYLIEKGRVTRPIKGATLIGNGPEVMNKISMVGDDLAFDTGVGVCGKEGQSVPVGVGQPTLKIDGLTVGGTC